MGGVDESRPRDVVASIRGDGQAGAGTDVAWGEVGVDRLLVAAPWRRFRGIRVNGTIRALIGRARSGRW